MPNDRADGSLEPRRGSLIDRFDASPGMGRRVTRPLQVRL
ncbi:MAG: hypothetical protein AVDCRST_MAG67-1581 [uncultured Solirubrobacteraceae bacterium]|uniref:Uncharacterized protein n=1 Tax=uncultured Solirubrobacteraceae bacterium TaxID=1162706 RepID=A0A6J4SDH2_9ACTN|nr:MAG: hypothetical protein AVDCRST_MAG67-1581 [uncultured Solirubrobacteraceae bacterium]